MLKKINLKIKIFILFLCVSFLTIFIIRFYSKYNKKTKASSSPIINQEEIEKESYFIKKQNTISFFLNNNENFIYKANEKEELAVIEFINKEPLFSKEQLSSQSGFFIKENSSNLIHKLIPENFLEDSFLLKKINDKEDLYLKKNNFFLDGIHLFYNQKIKNIPVFGGILTVHLRNENEIYAITGNLITENFSVPEEKITEEDALKIALKKAEEETNSSLPLEIVKFEKNILNLAILGVSEDNNNYLTLAVTIREKSNSDLTSLFYKKYFIDLNTGNILFSQNLTYSLLNRKIFDCKDGDPFTKGCKLVRKEGSPPTNDAEVDKAYFIFGEVYNYFKENFQRDSYDNKGGEIRSFINTPSSLRFPCPNAAAFIEGDFVFCEGLITKDVIAHEFTHLITYNTANLLYQSQSGALDESIADIFGYALDPEDWSIGEETKIFSRKINDPPNNSPSQPDRLFSPLYYCPKNEKECKLENDFCGVHINSGVINKFFYLLTNGGNFNGCNIKGIKKEKSLPLIYRALTTYLKPQANFKDFYLAVVQSCKDLFGSNSEECLQTISALQATEIDQQPENTQIAPTCNGSVEPKTPLCANINNQISPSPISPSPPPSNTNIIINLKLKFQGILKKPEDIYNKMRIRLIAINSSGETSPPSFGEFSADNEGIWKGSFSLKAAPGSGYKLLIKGPKHIQKKICDEKPIESKLGPGTYTCGEKGYITLKNGENNFDFSNILLLTGDLPVSNGQDGVVNSLDTSFIRNNLGKTDKEILDIGDLNLDGKVDTQDWSLVIAALNVRGDEGGIFEQQYNPPQSTPGHSPTIPHPSLTIPVTIPIPTNFNPTIIPSITITPQDLPSSGELRRDGTVYPVYVSLTYYNCSSKVKDIKLSLLNQNKSYQEAILVSHTTPPLLIGNINVNDLLAKDIKKGDTSVEFSPQANISVYSSEPKVEYNKNLNEAYFGMLMWCSNNAGCIDAPAPLKNQKFIHIFSLKVKICN